MKEETVVLSQAYAKGTLDSVHFVRNWFIQHTNVIVYTNVYT